MYAEYAKDPRMKLNLGIRRRLAPLLDNGRDEIELMTAILFSLPGSPVLYYGDEIAMGDNVFLGDRDGVRTPMQWTGDRNGGFSRADFAQLYAPPLMDPVYGFQAVNVEAQLRTPTSLLRWMHRFIALRKEHPVFGFGTYEPIQTSNPRIFAAIRALRGGHRPVRPQPRPLGPGGRARPQRLRGALSGRAVRALALPADRRAALPADAGRRGASTGSSWSRRGRTRSDELSPCRARAAGPARGRRPRGAGPNGWRSSAGMRRSRRHADRDRRRRVRVAGSASRRCCWRWSRRASPPAPTSSTSCRSCSWTPPTMGTRTPVAARSGWCGDRLAIDAWPIAEHGRALLRADRADGRARDRGGQLPLSPRGRTAALRRADPARRRRAVQQLGRVRRRDGPEGVPQARAGDQPGARDAALPDRARLRQHRAAAGLVRVRGALARGDAGRRPALPPRRDRRLGAGAGARSAPTPRAC